MKKLVIKTALLLLIALVIDSCQEKKGCCITGDRNTNGRITRTGNIQFFDNKTKKECKKICEEYRLASDWFEKSCELVNSNDAGEYEKGDTICSQSK